MSPNKSRIRRTYGDGETVNCAIRYPWPIAGRDGGRYTRDNIRPACISCNIRSGSVDPRQILYPLGLPHHLRDMTLDEAWDKYIKMLK